MNSTALLISPLSRATPSVFLTRPLSLTFIIATVLILVVTVRERRKEIAD